ncbi:MAG: hypothetical protein JW957_04195, partial [Candidatus Omnitrophica bacterium]|nr:hypothetical protein [Candidatus Omnitrophota bacterium]
KTQATAKEIKPFIIFYPNKNFAKYSINAIISYVSIPLAESEIKQATAGHIASEAEIIKLYDEKFKAFHGFSEEEVKKIKNEVRLEKVLAPYLPIKNSGEGIFTLTTSQYRFQDSIFPVSIKILGEEILSDAITLDISLAEGSINPESDKPRFKCSESEVILEQDINYGEGLKVSINGILSYDGMMIFSIKFSAPEAVEIKSVTFRVPLSAKIAKYARYGSFGDIVPGSKPAQYSGRRYESIDYGFGPIPPAGEKVEVKYALLSGRWKNGWNPRIWDENHPVIWEWTQERGLHLAELWVGDEQKGLRWISESPRGWHYEKNDTTCMLEKKGDSILASRMFITKPLRIQGEREIQFAIQALPPKHVREDWFTLKVASPLFNKELAGKIYESLGEEERKFPVFDYRKTGELSPSFPHNWCIGHGTPRAENPDAFRKDSAILEYFGRRLLPYMAPTHIAVNTPEGYFYTVKTEEWAIKPRYAWLAKSIDPAEIRGSIVKVCVNSFYSEFMASDIGKFIDDYGISGLYFDNCTPGGCVNTEHGCGYKNDTGEIRPTVPFFALRKYFMMVRNEFLKRGKEPLIFCHAGVLPSELSFVDCVLSGEGLYGLDLSENVSLEEFRAYMIGPNQTGAVYFFLPQALGVDPKEAMKEETVRRSLAMTLIHGTQIWPGFCHMGPVAKSREVLGRLEEEKVRFLPYWEWIDINTELNKKKVYASIYLQSSRAVLAISNLSQDDIDVSIPRALIEAVFPGLQSVKDVMDYFPVDVDNEYLLLRLPGKDFRLLLLENNLVVTDGQENTGGWKTFRRPGENAAVMHLSEEEARSGSDSLKVTIPVTMQTQGVQRVIKVTPGQRYRITAYAKGEGEIQISAEGQSGCIDGNPVKLTSQWQKLSASLYVKDSILAPSVINVFGSPWHPANLEKEHKSFSFFIDDFQVEQEPVLTFPEVNIPAMKFSAVNYCLKVPNAAIINDPSGISFVETRNGFDFVRKIPYPQTSKPVYIYLKLFVEEKDSRTVIKVVSYQPGQKGEPVFCSRISSVKEWVWLKTGPFTPGEIAEKEFAVSYYGSAPKARLSAIVVTTMDNLTEQEMEDAQMYKDGYQ